MLLLHGRDAKGEDEGEEDHLQGGGAAQHGRTDKTEGEGNVNLVNIADNIQANKEYGQEKTTNTA